MSRASPSEATAPAICSMEGNSVPSVGSTGRQDNGWRWRAPTVSGSQRPVRPGSSLRSSNAEAIWVHELEYVGCRNHCRLATPDRKAQQVIEPMGTGPRDVDLGSRP